MKTSQTKQENPFNNILINVIIPVIVLTVFSKERFLGPFWGLIAALILPIGYGLKAIIIEKRCDMFSVLGVVSVLLTGIFGILELPAEWVAIKEAMIPLIIGLAIVISLKTPFPLIKKILMTESLFDVPRLKSALKERGTEAVFEKRLVGLTWGLASSFFLSTILNYLLAKIVLKSAPGTDAYTAELGKMTGLGYIVVMIPSMAIMIGVLIALVKTLKKLTGLEFDDMLAEAHREKPKESAPMPEKPITD